MRRKPWQISSIIAFVMFSYATTRLLDPEVPVARAVAFIVLWLIVMWLLHSLPNSKISRPDFFDDKK